MRSLSPTEKISGITRCHRSLLQINLTATDWHTRKGYHLSLPKTPELINGKDKDSSLGSLCELHRSFFSSGRSNQSHGGTPCSAIASTDGHLGSHHFGIVDPGPDNGGTGATTTIGGGEIRSYFHCSCDTSNSLGPPIGTFLTTNDLHCHAKRAVNPFGEGLPTNRAATEEFGTKREVGIEKKINTDYDSRPCNKKAPSMRNGNGKESGNKISILSPHPNHLGKDLLKKALWHRAKQCLDKYESKLSKVSHRLADL